MQSISDGPWIFSDYRVFYGRAGHLHYSTDGAERISAGISKGKRRSWGDRNRLKRNWAVAWHDAYGHQPLQAPEKSLPARWICQTFRPDECLIEGHGSYDTQILSRLLPKLGEKTVRSLGRCGDDVAPQLSLALEGVITRNALWRSTDCPGWGLCLVHWYTGPPNLP